MSRAPSPPFRDPGRRPAGRPGRSSAAAAPATAKAIATANAEGITLITATLPRSLVGPYQIQAAIAALHGEAGTAEETDWPQILALYRLLERLAPNPVTTVNRAVATAMVHGPGPALALVESLAVDDRMGRHHRLAAVRAHLREMAGELAAAHADYLAAARLTTSLPERRYLESRAARLAVGTEVPPPDGGEPAFPPRPRPCPARRDGPGQRRAT